MLNTVRKKLLSILFITCLSISTLIGVYLIYEWQIGTHYFNFTLRNKTEIKLVADECTECFLDWPIDFTLKIKAPDSNNFSSFQFDTGNGPELRFYSNINHSNLILVRGFNNNGGLNWIVNSQNSDIHFIYELD